MKYSLYLIFSLLVLSGCKKELSLEGQIPEQPIPKYHLVAFYSETPIDFDHDDNVVKSETDLNAYVLDYLWDDLYTFLDDGKLQIEQNEKKMPGLNDPILYRTYFFGKDSHGDYVTYLTFTYEQLNYRLIERTEDYFVISTNWNGDTVFTRLERIQ